MNKNYPKYLYKYRPINKNTIKLLTCNEAYFSLPTDFNDPFDCNIIPRFIYTQRELATFLIKLKKRDGYQNFEEDIQYLRNNPIDILNKHVGDAIEKIRNNIRVYCLSQVNNNVLMYAHYADGHKGICLEFKFDDHLFFNTLNFVRYRRKYPMIHPFKKGRIDAALIIDEVLTKSTSWNYEKEWRILKEGEKSLYQFSPNTLTAIIFGCQTPYEDKLLIRNLVANRKPSVQLKEVFKMDNSFCIDIKPARFE